MSEIFSMNWYCFLRNTDKNILTAIMNQTKDDLISLVYISDNNSHVGKSIRTRNE